MDEVASLAASIAAADTTVALSGAGVSAPSGVPTFRGEDGLWERFDPEQFSQERFRADPGGFWRDRLELQDEMALGSVEPNAAHRALEDLVADGHLDAILTQNVDGLHEGAAAEVLELHGNAGQVRCLACDRTAPAGPVADRVAAGTSPPRCACGGLLKPDVVLFGEALPEAVLGRARALARESDVFLAVGSSLVVEPAAALPRLAAETGATLAVVNLEATPCDGLATHRLGADVTAVLPRLAAAVGDP